MRNKKRAWQLRLIGLGLLLTVVVMLADEAHWIDAPERWFYDHRVIECQFFRTPPSDKVFHLEIDDGSLQEIGKWPWPRSFLAQILDELTLAGPKVVGMDMDFPDTERQPDGTFAVSPNDIQFADSIRRAGNVLLPISIEFQNPTATVDPLTVAMNDALHGDLEMQADQMTALLIGKGFSTDAVHQAVTSHLSTERNEAMMDRLNQAVERDAVDPEKLRQQILPKEAGSDIFGEATQLLYDDYPAAMAVKATHRFTLPPMPQVPLAPAPKAKTANIPIFAAGARYSGFFDLLPADDGTVRSLPLLVNYANGVLPHMTLNMACAMLDVNPADIQCTADSIILPSRGRKPVVIPVHIEDSFSLGRVAAVFDIPFFGRRNNWQTMYDFGRYRDPVGRMSIKNIWRVIRTARQIPSSNATVDEELKIIASYRETNAAAHYLKNIPDLSDTAARVTAITGTLKELDEQGFSQLASAPDDQLSDAEKELAKLLRKLQNARDHLQEQNNQSIQFLQQARADLRQKIQGKAVIIGWSAEGAVDLHATSLHAVCPGEIIQGAVLNGILTGQMWQRLPQWVTLLCTLALGLLTSLIVMSISPFRAVFCTLALAAGYAVINGELLFDYGHFILGAAGPLFAILGVWAGMTLYRVIFESAEKARITRRFRSYVDPRVVDYFLENTQLSELRGQRRDMSVVFTDLQGFSRLSEKLEEEVVPIINEYMGRMLPIIRANEGTWDKFIGDGIMFFFNAPMPTVNHASKAVAAVLQMQNETEQLSKELRSRSLPPVAMRAGVCTGMMIVGDAGSLNKDFYASSYTVLGDLVNLASRLEGANKLFGTNSLVIGETVSAAPDVLFRPIGKIRVYGKDQATQVFEPISPRASATPEQYRLAELSAQVVQQFREHRWHPCMETIRLIESQFGASLLWDFYRDRIDEGLRQPSPEFDDAFTLNVK